MALTDRKVRLAKAEDRPYKLSDSDGLYLFVSKTGVKSWRYDFRFGGKRLTYTLGTYPSLSLAEARQDRDDARKLVSRGENPIGARKKERAVLELEKANTFEKWKATYLDSLRDKKLSQTTIDKNEWVLGIVGEDVDHLPMSEIDTATIFKSLKKIEASGRLETAKRAKSVVSNVFTLAVLSGAAPFDPTYPIRRALKSPRRNHHPAIIREDRFGEMLAKVDRYRSIHTRLILQFCAIAFPRPIEIRMATWDEFDLKDGVWSIPAERMKMRRPHDVPLSKQAKVILHQARKLYRTNSEAPGYVFPSGRSMFKMISENTMNHALWSLGYKGEQTSHGFRSSASTILNERGYRRDAIEMQLAHFEEGTVEKTYNRALYWEDRVKMMQDWADLLDDLRSDDTG